MYSGMEDNLFSYKENSTFSSQALTFLAHTTINPNALPP
jgi:hypothetical protein